MLPSLPNRYTIVFRTLRLVGSITLGLRLHYIFFAAFHKFCVRHTLHSRQTREALDNDLRPQIRTALSNH